MADFDLSQVSPENIDEAETFSVPWIAAHSIGDIVQPDGAIVAAIGNQVGGVVIRVGDAKNKTLVMRRGILRNVAGAAAAAKAPVYSDGDGTASDAKPAGAAGTQITRVGVIADQADRMLVDVQSYEKGA